MSIKTQKVRIIRSELHQVVDDYPTWEVPLLEAVHDAVQIIGEGIQSGRELPDAKEEYQRLETRYPRQKNDDGSLGLPSVAAVYGQSTVGVQALKRAINEAAVSEDSLI